jgi:hypothetical protein
LELDRIERRVDSESAETLGEDLAREVRRRSLDKDLHDRPDRLRGCSFVLACVLDELRRLLPRLLARRVLEIGRYRLGGVAQQPLVVTAARVG